MYRSGDRANTIMCAAIFFTRRLNGDGIDLQVRLTRDQHASFMRKFRLELAELDPVDWET